MENFFDRLGNIIRSYIDDDSVSTFGTDRSRSDPDYASAYDDLESFLNGGSSSSSDSKKTGWEQKPDTDTRRHAGQTVQREYKPKPRIPAELSVDFQNLGVSFGDTLDNCKTAYKALLKKHHPDKHAGNPDALKKATALSAKINASFQRIEYWYTNGKLPS